VVLSLAFSVVSPSSTHPIEPGEKKSTAFRKPKFSTPTAPPRQLT
jgi:hypothetical protein